LNLLKPFVCVARCNNLCELKDYIPLSLLLSADLIGGRNFWYIKPSSGYRYKSISENGPLAKMVFWGSA
jgi:hypothetical protein